MGSPGMPWATSPILSVAAPATAPGCAASNESVGVDSPACSPRSSDAKGAPMRAIGIDVHRDSCEVAISEGGELRSAGRVPSTPHGSGAAGHQPGRRRRGRPRGDRQRPGHRPHHRAPRGARRRGQRQGAARHHGCQGQDRPSRRPHAGQAALGRPARGDLGYRAKTCAPCAVGSPTAPSSCAPARASRAQPTRRFCATSSARRRRPTSPRLGSWGLPASSCPQTSARRSTAACARWPSSTASEIARFEQAIARFALSSPEIRRLVTIPGVGLLMPPPSSPWPRHPPFPLGPPAGRLPRPRPTRTAVGQHNGAHRPHLQGGPLVGARRACFCEAAHAALRSPGPLRAFGQRVAARRGRPIAVVALGAKLAVIAWHLLRSGEDYAYANPAQVRLKWRRIELSSRRGLAEGAPDRRLA